MSTQNEKQEQPVNAMHQLINEYIDRHVESNALQLTDAQRNDMQSGITCWLTVELQEAVSDAITMLAPHEKQEQPVGAMYQLIDEYINMYAESNNVQLTDAQRNDIHRGVTYWLTETLPDAVSDTITYVT